MMATISTANEPGLTPEAHKLFTDAVAYMLAHTDNFDMSSWCYTDVCGTTLCFGGIILTLAGYTTNEDGIFRCQDGMPLDCMASLSVLLGVGRHEVDKLFLSSYWPEDFSVRFYEIPYSSRRQRALEAANRFNYFLETGE